MMIQDSGKRREYESGAVRDIQEGKGRCDLMPLDVVAEYMALGNNFYSLHYRHITLDLQATLNEDTMTRRYMDVSFKDATAAFSTSS